MLSKNTLFEFLYQNLHDQITCGHLKYGDTLPSMPQLAAIYNVGIRTVKDVLSRLKAEGLIRTAERKPALVIYRAPKNSGSQSYAAGLLRRQGSLTEVYQTMGLILPPLFHFAAAHYDIKNLPSYQKLIKKINSQDPAALDAAFSSLLNELLRSSNNLLFNDLYNSLKTYSKVTLAAPKNLLVKYDPENFRQLLDALLSNDYRLVNKRFKKMYFNFSESVNSYILKLSRKYQPADLLVPVYDYSWSAEKGRDHYYTQIARDLIDKIALSLYEPGTLLPYEAILAKNYKVSISTIRKALALLNEIGFAETINTKGTIVRLPPTFITANCLQNERYKKDTLIYLSALQLMSVIIKPAAFTAADRIDPVLQKNWQAEFGQPGKVPLALIINALIELTELQPLRTILQETNKLLHWGYYLAFHRQNLTGTTDTLSKYTWQAYLCLEARDMDGFSTYLAICFSYILETIRDFIVQNGLQEAAKIATPYKIPALQII